MLSDALQVFLTGFLQIPVRKTVPDFLHLITGLTGLLSKTVRDLDRKQRFWSDSDLKRAIFASGVRGYMFFYVRPVKPVKMAKIQYLQLLQVLKRIGMYIGRKYIFDTCSLGIGFKAKICADNLHYQPMGA